LNLLKNHLGKPELNVYNELATRKRFLVALKVKFLKKLAHDYMANLPLPFEI